MSYATEVLSDNPAAYWRLGELSGTTLVDAAGHGHDGTYVGGVTLAQPGALVADTDTCVLFDGSSGFGSSGVSGVDISTGDWTLEAWVYPTAFGAVVHRGIIGSDGSNTYALIEHVGSGKLAITNVNIDEAALSNTVMSLGQWSHVAATFVDSSNLLTYYLNGQPDGSTTYTTTPPRARRRRRSC